MAGGRPTKLDPSTLQCICNAIRQGLGYEQAATIGGISYSTLRGWVLRAEAERKRLEVPKTRPKKSEKPFLEFLDALQRAEVEGELNNADTVNNAALGGLTFTETKQTKSWDAATKTFIVTEETITTKTTLPDWRAAAFILERRHSDRWGRKDKTELNGTVKTEDVGLTDEERLERIAQLFNKARAGRA